MRRILAVVACGFLAASPLLADEFLLPGDTISNNPSGLLIIRQGNQTTWSLGGLFLPRNVKVVTATSEGKTTERFWSPSIFHDPNPPSLPIIGAPAVLHVEIPDPMALLYVDGELIRTRGTSRDLQLPRLQLGKVYSIQVRAAFAVGEMLLIEERQVEVRAGESTPVRFDGSRAFAVPLPRAIDPVSRSPPAR